MKVKFINTKVDELFLKQLKKSIPLELQTGNSYFQWTKETSWVFVPATK